MDTHVQRQVEHPMEARGLQWSCERRVSLLVVLGKEGIKYKLELVRGLGILWGLKGCIRP